MGMSDTFHDEDVECPKCHSKVREWQTKRLQSFMEVWNKGDFLQYRKLEDVPDEERRRKDGSISLFGAFRRSKEYVSDAPLLFNGKVPVHTSCDNCKAWLEAYAKIVKGRFTGITEIEAGGSPKELVVIKPETTAEELRQEFRERLSQLQDSCDHIKTRWTILEWAPAHQIPGESLVCLKCEKTLDSKETVARSIR